MMKHFLKSIVCISISLFGFLVYAENNDVKAFQLNQTQKFFTKDHSKAKGINISLEYPESWIAKEGERPNIVQKFVKVLDDGTTIMCMISIHDIPEAGDFSDEEIAQEIFSKEATKSMIGMFGPNSKLLEHTQTKYDGQPGALISYTTVQERVGIKMSGYILRHAFVYSKKFVVVECSVGGLLSNAYKIEELYKNYAPLFTQIGISIVIQDKWEKETLEEEHSTIFKTKEGRLMSILKGFGEVFLKVLAVGAIIGIVGYIIAKLKK